MFDLIFGQRVAINFKHFYIENFVRNQGETMWNVFHRKSCHYLPTFFFYFFSLILHELLLPNLSVLSVQVQVENRTESSQNITKFR